MAGKGTACLCEAKVLKLSPLRRRGDERRRGIQGEALAPGLMADGHKRCSSVFTPTLPASCVSTSLLVAFGAEETKGGPRRAVTNSQ